MRKVAVITLMALGLVEGSLADGFGQGANYFGVEFVDVGFTGNVAKTQDYGTLGGSLTFGTVDYEYRIGKYEITIDQFLKATNADNRIGDDDENYWDDGERTVGSNAPASKVSWYEAAKFCNWLTSGDAYNGAYLFNTNGTLTGVNRDLAMYEYGTVYLLPTEDEWFKAAYYKPIDDGSYSLYTSGYDDLLTHGTPYGWNYYHGYEGTVNSSPNFTWYVGYGAFEQNYTYDMTGNVWEWLESAYDGVLDSMSEWRTIRGGGYGNYNGHLPRSLNRFDENPAQEQGMIGFRIVAIDGDDDKDDDLIDDLWEVKHFGSITNCAPSDDPDNDNYSNLEEFKNNTSPHTWDIYLGCFTSIELVWKTVEGTNYQIQCSSTLASNSWANLGDEIAGDGLTNIYFHSTRNSDKKYYRIITAP